MIDNSERSNYFKNDEASVLSIETTLRHITYEMDQQHMADVPSFWEDEFPAQQAENQSSKCAKR